MLIHRRHGMTRRTKARYAGKEERCQMSMSDVFVHFGGREEDPKINVVSELSSLVFSDVIPLPFSLSPLG